ncbi:MAG: FG-GAP-like repeat-containing protein [Deltaproteobacteria bacterium]|nr:FG-GAP-like repeat-containing protein [Deltaproteobacteria bacterium]
MKYIRKPLFLFLTISILLAPAGSAAEPVKKVAIFPFQMNAPEDLNYLREGIMDMLASRLAWEGKVEVIEKQAVKNALAGHQGPINESAAREVGSKLGADYVLFGSLTVFGESVSIDAKMVGLKEDNPPVTVYAQTKGLSEVIPRINEFAQDINNKIFGRGTAAVASAPAQPRFSKAHPETIMSGPAVGPIKSEDTGSFVSLQSKASSDSDLFRSQRLKFPVNGMDVGDIDGDGRPEIVVLSTFKEVLVYQWDQGRLNKRTSFRGSTRDRLVWVCLLDANHDGKDEIYVSNLRGQRLSSYVLEWKGEELQELASEVEWYFNSLKVAGRDLILLGQKKSTQDIFTAGVYRLQFADGTYEPLEGIGLPHRANVYNFTQGDIDGDGKDETVFIGAEERLYLYDDDGSRLWQSREYYGATDNILEGKAPVTSGSGATVEDEVETFYIPSPILLVDLNQDKQLEILANRNISLSSRMISRVRNFSDGDIESLIWTGGELLPQWKTRPLRGMVVSYRLADMDGDGQDELVAAVVLEKQTFQKTKSMIYVYELDGARALSGQTTAPGIIESN